MRSLLQFKQLFRQKIKVVMGGPANLTRGAGLLAVLDAIGEDLKASPNSKPGLLKAYRLLTRAEIKKNGGFGEAFEDLDYSTACINTRVIIEFYQPDLSKPRLTNQTLVAVYDATAPLSHYVHVDGSFREGDITPAKFVPADSEEAKYGYVRRYEATIANWRLEELVIFEQDGQDQFATAKRAGGPLGAPSTQETDDWKPASAPAMAGGPGGAAKDYVSTETLGGITAGDKFTTADQTFVQLLVKYQAPGFGSFAIANQGSRTVLVGTPYDAGFKSFTWSTSNSKNVQDNSLQLWDVTAQAILASNEANDGVLSASTAAFKVGLGLSRRYRLTGQNSKGNFFTADIDIYGAFESYFGYVDANGVLDMATLRSLGGNVLQGGKGRTVSGVTAGPGLFTVYAWPSNGSDDITQVLQDGVDSIRGAFGPVRYATGPNSLGVSNTVGYIISNADNAFTNSSLAFI